MLSFNCPVIAVSIAKTYRYNRRTRLPLSERLDSDCVIPHCSWSGWQDSCKMELLPNPPQWMLDRVCIRPLGQSHSCSTPLDRLRIVSRCNIQEMWQLCTIIISLQNLWWPIIMSFPLMVMKFFHNYSMAVIFDMQSYNTSICSILSSTKGKS